MAGHHLIHGKLVDFITGKTIDDTDDERYLQNLARLLIYKKEYHRDDLITNSDLLVKADHKQAIVKVDFLVELSGKICMMLKYGPGSIVTRHRPALSASRLVAHHQVPVVGVTNGETADILDGSTGKVLSRGLESIPSRSELIDFVSGRNFGIISKERSILESRIIYAFEVDGSCPCDDSICRL